MNIIVTCEHGGNKIPKKYLSLFRNKKKILNSHRGWDQGALVLANKIARDLSVPLFYSETSRLLIDLYRSLHHPGLFSEFSKPCDKAIKQEIINKIYLPYRSKVEDEIKNSNSKSPTIHFSVHSFTPRLHGETRNADMGLLYDPARKPEKEFCDKLRHILKIEFPNLVIRCNYPYKGKADGFTACLRKQFSEKKYLGIEIEINQKHVKADNAIWLMINIQMGKVLLNMPDNSFI